MATLIFSKIVTNNKGESTSTLIGELTRFSILKIQNKSVQQLYKQNIIIDLSGITQTDTAGLAWLILLKKQAIKKQKEIHFSHFPEKLINLMTLSGVNQYMTQENTEN